MQVIAIALLLPSWIAFIKSWALCRHHHRRHRRLRVVVVQTK